MVKWHMSVRTAILNAVASTFGASPVLDVYTGAEPALGAAATGTHLLSYTLPSTPFGVSGATLSGLGMPLATAALAAGTPGYYRLRQGATVLEQGSVTVGAGGDAVIDASPAAVGQVVNLLSYVKTAPHPA
jgi:hypothetical protein